MQPAPSPVAYSYVRFSHPDQAKGDSLRRQTEATKAWCERSGVRLDESITLHDLGRSAYTGEHRKNPDRHALAAFLKLVEAGKVERGSYLVIENLDRLSREDERKALRLWMDLLDQGINIVQLKPETIFRHDRSDMFDIMRAIMELGRGHSESRIKSERVGAAWREKKRRVRDGEEQKPTKRMGDGCSALTRRLPAWVEEHDGRLALIPDRAAVVKRIFRMSGCGYGAPLIVKRLTGEKVQAFGNREIYVGEDGKERFRAVPGGVLGSGRWSRAYVGLILKDKRVLGEYQPRKRDGSPDGPVIPNYFPPVISEEEFCIARSAAAGRRKKPGRVGNRVELFSGLLTDAYDGGSYYVATRTDGGKHTRVLINTNAAEGRAPCRSFPLATFEAAVLSLLTEIDPREVLEGDAGPDETMRLAGQLAGIEGKIAELEAELLNGEVAALARVLRQLEDQKREIARQLAVAREKVANPLSEAWGETRTLLDALAKAADCTDARVRLRGVLRRVIHGIWLLVVARGRDRLCAVEMWFTNGKSARHYLILHRPAKANARARVKGEWHCWSFAEEISRVVLGADPGSCWTLSTLESAAKYAESLERLDVTTMLKAAKA